MSKISKCLRLVWAPEEEHQRSSKRGKREPNSCIPSTERRIYVRLVVFYGYNTLRIVSVSNVSTCLRLVFAPEEEHQRSSKREQQEQSS